MSNAARPSLFDGVPPSDDLTLEDRAFMLGITSEMVDAAVQASLEYAFRAQVEQFIGPWDWERDEPKA